MYLDVQGGNRSTIANMNAILELLKNRDVKVKGRFANNFGREKNIWEIKEVSEDYKTYNLVTAMTTFKKYGRSDELLQFFQPYGRDEKEGKLVRAITNATKAIQSCNIDAFDEAIRDIQELHTEFQNSETKTYLDVVYKDIWEDYAPLMDTKYPYVAQIRWCLKKKFVQQAFTILEAKMPTEYVNAGLVYYCKQESEKKSVLDKFQKYYECLYLEESKSRKEGAYKMGDINHYFIVDCERDQKRESDLPKIERYYGTSKTEVEKHLKKYRSIKNGRNEMSHAESKPAKGGFAERMAKLYPEDRTWKTGRDKKDLESMVIAYLNEFEALAEQAAQKGVKSINLA